MATLLIVDDDPEGAKMLAAFLESSGHRVEVYANGRVALDAVLKEIPDLIILDLAMPEMDGPTFLEIMRSYRGLQNVPVIILSGRDDEHSLSRVRAQKVERIFLKGSALPDDIEKCVEGVLSRSNDALKARD